MKAIKSVFHVSTNTGRGCPEGCGASVSGTDDFAGAVNHLVSSHGYTVEHVGQETSRDNDGRPWQSTVAVLAKRE